MIYCSVDLAFSTTGLCISDSELNILDVKKITTCYGEIKDKCEDEKIVFVCDAIIALCKVWDVVHIILEDQFAGSNIKTAMQLNRLRGALTYASITNNISIEYIQASTVKKVVTEYVGVSLPKGSDSKAIVAECVMEIYKDNNVVNAVPPYSDKNNKNKTSDMYDAIALATTHGIIRHKL